MLPCKLRKCISIEPIINYKLLWDGISCSEDEEVLLPYFISLFTINDFTVPYENNFSMTSMSLVLILIYALTVVEDKFSKIPKIPSLLKNPQSLRSCTCNSGGGTNEHIPFVFSKTPWMWRYFSIVREDSEYMDLNFHFPWCNYFLF